MPFETIADTAGGIFADFRPYVPGVDADGAVVFQAVLASGAEGVFEWTPQNGVAQVALGSFVSHPARTPDRRFCAYHEDPAHLWTSWEGEASTGLSRVGPLGPTMNRQGSIALRGTDAFGIEGVYLWHDEQLIEVASVGDRFEQFHGLPVVNDSLDVVFRAESDRGHGVYRWSSGTIGTLAEAENLGFFPSLDNTGQVGYCQPDCAILWDRGNVTTVSRTSDGFESIRHCFPRGKRMPAIVATPTGGSMSLFIGKRLLSLGDPWDGSSVNEFALNPVSISESGVVALRVLLESGRQIILRWAD